MDACSAVGVVCEADRNVVTVELTPPPRCRGCSGACLWYRVPENERLTLTAAEAIPVGTKVTVSLPERQLLLGALVVYGLPLVAVLAGGAVGAATFGSDWAVAMGAAAAFVGALWSAASVRRRVEGATVKRLVVRPTA